MKAKRWTLVGISADTDNGLSAEFEQTDDGAYCTASDTHKLETEITRLKAELGTDQLTWRAEAKKLRVENKRLKAELNTAYERMEDLLTMAKSGLYGAGNIWSEAGNWFDKHGKEIRTQENEE